MKEDLRKYLPSTTAVGKIADAKAADERIRKATRDRPTPAVDPPPSKRRKYPLWLVWAGAMAAVLVPTSLALIVASRVAHEHDKETIPAASVTEHVITSAAPTAIGAIPATSATPVESATPEASAAATAEPHRQTSPKKTPGAAADASTAPAAPASTPPPPPTIEPKTTPRGPASAPDPFLHKRSE